MMKYRTVEENERLKEEIRVEDLRNANNGQLLVSESKQGSDKEKWIKKIKNLLMPAKVKSIQEMVSNGTQSYNEPGIEVDRRIKQYMSKNNSTDYAAALDAVLSQDSVLMQEYLGGE